MISGVSAMLMHWYMILLNSLGISDAIWWQRSGSTLVQVMACCLMAPSHYLNQCWLMTKEVLWHSLDSNFTENTSDIYHWNEFEIYQFETVVKSHRGQWVKISRSGQKAAIFQMTVSETNSWKKLFSILIHLSLNFDLKDQLTFCELCVR